MLKKSLGLSIVVLFAAALFLFTGCDNPADTYNYNFPEPGYSNNSDGGEHNFYETNPNIPAPIYPVDLKPFIEGGVGWITTTLDPATPSDEPDRYGYTVEVFYADPGTFIDGLNSSPGVTPWGYDVRLIAVYTHSPTGKVLETLGELDQVTEYTVPEGTSQLAIRMLGWDTPGSSSNVFYVSGQTGTTNSIGDRNNAQAVFVNYKIVDNVLTFVDGWLSPVLKDIPLAKKSLPANLDGRIFVHPSAGNNSTYHFRSTVNLLGVSSQYYTQASSGAVIGQWWTVNGIAYTQSTAGVGIDKLGEIDTAGGLSINGTPWVELVWGGGGFADRIWAAPVVTNNAEYVSFSKTQVVSSANLGGSSTDAIATAVDWFGAKDTSLGFPKIAKLVDDTTPGSYGIEVIWSGSYDAGDNEFTFVPNTLTEIKHLSDSSAEIAAAKATLSGIWADLDTAVEYFYINDTSYSVSDDSSAFGVGEAIWTGGETAGANSKSGDLFEVTTTVSPYTVVYAATYAYNTTTLALGFADSVSAGSTTLIQQDLTILSPSAVSGIWVQESIAGPYYVSIGSQNPTLTYGTASVPTATSWAAPAGSGLTWYVNAAGEIFARTTGGAIVCIGTFGTGNQTIVTTGAAPQVFTSGTGTLNKIVTPQTNLFTGKVWGRADPSTPGNWAAVFEIPKTPGQYGYSLAGDPANIGTYHQDAADSDSVYFYDVDARGWVKIAWLGTFQRLGYMNQSPDGLLFAVGGAVSSGAPLTVTPFTKGSSAFVENGVKFATNNTDPLFVDLKSNGDVSVDIDGATTPGSDGVSTGTFYSSVAAPALAAIPFYVIDDDDASFKLLGGLLYGGVSSPFAYTSLTGIVGGVTNAATPLDPLAADTAFAAAVSTSKWGVVGSSPDAFWIYKTTSGYRYGTDSYTGAEITTPALFSYESTTDKNELFSYDSSSGNAVFLGQYDISVGDTITFAGTGGTFSGLTTPVVELTLGAPADLTGKWASPSAAGKSALISIASNKITIETGAFTDASGYVLPGNRKAVIRDNEDVYHSGTGPFVLYSLDADGDLGYLGTTSAITAAGVPPSTPLAQNAASTTVTFTADSSPIAGIVNTNFGSVSDLTLPALWQGSWLVNGGSTVGVDGIVITGTNITIGSNDTTTFTLGAKNLNGTLYASLVTTATVNYGTVDFYVHNASVGLVYVGRGIYSKGVVSANDPDTLTFTAATTVVRAGKLVFEK
jgi:hypothetical protein